MTPFPSPQPLYTPAEFAQAIRFSLPTIYEWIHDGRIKAHRINRSYRIPHSEVMRVLGELEAGRMEE